MSEGGTKKNRLESQEKLIEAEMENWSKLGISPGSFNADQFFLHCSAVALFEIIRDKLGVDEDEMNIVLKGIILRELTALREQLEPQLQAARLAAMEQQIVPRIFMPWEKPDGNGG